MVPNGKNFEKSGPRRFRRVLPSPIKSTSKIPKFAWVFSLAFFPLGLGGVFLSALDLPQGFSSRHWQMVDGIVLSSVLEKKFLSPNQPEIRYEYTVNGHNFVS